MLELCFSACAGHGNTGAAQGPGAGIGQKIKGGRGWQKNLHTVTKRERERGRERARKAANKLWSA